MLSIHVIRKQNCSVTFMSAEYLGDQVRLSVEAEDEGCFHCVRTVYINIIILSLSIGTPSLHVYIRSECVVPTVVKQTVHG